MQLFQIISENKNTSDDEPPDGNKNILAAVNLMLQENEDEEIFEVSF